MNLHELWSNIRDNENFSEVKGDSLKSFLNGNFLMKDFIRKQYGLVILLAVLSFTYIDNRFYCEKQQAKVVELRKELKETKYEALTISAELMQMSRQSNVLRLLRACGSNLQESTEPPVRIK